MNSKVIVALDFNSIDEVLNFIKGLNPNECRLKVGKELFTAYGPEIIRELHKLNFEVFLDLKFHDIPNTVYKAIKVAAKLGVWMVNVHASGGREMLLKAKLAISESEHKPLLIAVTVLTSMSEEDLSEIAYIKPLKEQVIHLARMSYECGLDGVVCSALEANAIKSSTNINFITVTPGIRLAGSCSDDQTRVMTPRNAIKNGADYLVIGRPITQSLNPIQSLQQINKDILSEL